MSGVGERGPRRIRTPFAVLADHVVLGGRALRWGTTAALLVSILLVVTGGVVRVTGSGLGCPTWPVCEAGSLATTPALGIHGAIEFGNRLLTTVLCLAVGWAIVAARLQPVRQRPLTRLAWSQFWLVVVNAVAGGITVWTGLNPYVVALHFLLAFALLTTTTLTWHRARQSDEAATVAGAAGPLTWLLTAVHGSVAIATILLALVLLVVLRRAGAGAALVRRRVVVLLGVLAAQAAIGIVQAFTGLPALFVVLHLAGAAFVWVGVLRVLLDVRPALFGRVRPLAVAAAPAREPASTIAGTPQRPATPRVPST
jgi:cytochrome c oxidase assembly protein subunit 15